MTNWLRATLAQHPQGGSQSGPISNVAQVALIVTFLVLVRCICSALLPLTSDEAYYWLWSKHLSAGYLDHPPAIAWLIRLGTAVFGDTSLGVRFGADLASAAATFFVWRAGTGLLGSELAGARSALWFNLTLLATVELLAATPDALVLLAASAVLCALVLVRNTDEGAWWTAAGISGGLALLSKFTAFFLAAGTLVWMFADPRARKWLTSAWPYAGAAVAVLFWLPNLAWNREHGWATFLFQFGRVTQGHLTLRFFGEFLASQLALCSPFVFILGALGLARATHEKNLRLLAAMLWPAIGYFLLHSLHDRVQANWPSFLLPSFAIAAVCAAEIANKGQRRPTITFMSRAAAPVAAAMLLLVYLQALFGVVPMGRIDPLGRLLGVGFADVAAKVDSVRKNSNARGVVVSDYASAGWFGFYLPSHVPIIAASEPERWTFAPGAGRDLLSQPLLYVAEKRVDRHDAVAAHFEHVTFAGEIERRRGGIVIARYVVYRLAGLRGAAFGQILP